MLGACHGVRFLRSVSVGGVLGPAPSQFWSDVRHTLSNERSSCRSSQTGAVWGQYGVSLGSLGSVWGQSGVSMESVWGSVWDQSGKKLGPPKRVRSVLSAVVAPPRKLGQSGVSMESVWD